MTDTEFCVKCQADIEIEYVYEDVGDAESGPCIAITDVKLSCGHDVADIKGHWVCDCEDGCYECGVDLESFR